MINYQQSLAQIFGTNTDFFNGENKMVIDRLAGVINKLIVEDFAELVQILYRMDVSEMKLKQQLISSPKEDAGILIAKMIIERQKQKEISIRKYGNSFRNTDAEEKW